MSQSAASRPRSVWHVVLPLLRPSHQDRWEGVAESGGDAVGLTHNEPVKVRQGYARLLHVPDMRTVSCTASK